MQTPGAWNANHPGTEVAQAARTRRPQRPATPAKSPIHDLVWLYHAVVCRLASVARAASLPSARSREGKGNAKGLPHPPGKAVVPLGAAQQNRGVHQGTSSGVRHRSAEGLQAVCHLGCTRPGSQRQGLPQKRPCLRGGASGPAPRRDQAQQGREASCPAMFPFQLRCHRGPHAANRAGYWNVASARAARDDRLENPTARADRALQDMVVVILRSTTAFVGQACAASPGCHKGPRL